MRLNTPTAILIGLLSIAVAVFFALRARVAPGKGGDGTATVSADGASIAGPPPVYSKAAPAPEATGAIADATRGLDAQHDALVKACFGNAKDRHVAYAVRMQFDDQGHSAARVQLSPRGPLPPLEVSECIANHLTPIEIAKGNAPANVEVQLTLP